MSNLLTPGLRDDYADARVYDAMVRARAWRARAIRHAFRQLVDGVSTLAGLVRRWYARRMAYEHLMVMNDRQLEDVGLTRGQIRDAVYGRYVAKGEALGCALVALGRRIATWRQRQVARGQLLALDDHLLSDIGLRRADIEAAIRSVELPDLVADNENQRPAARHEAPRDAA